MLPGTDQALAHLLIEAGTFNREFMRQCTNASLLVRADTGRLLRQGDLEAGGCDTVLYGIGDGERLVPYDAARRVGPEGSAGAALVGALHVKTLAAEVAAARPPSFTRWWRPSGWRIGWRGSPGWRRRSRSSGISGHVAPEYPVAISMSWCLRFADIVSPHRSVSSRGARVPLEGIMVIHDTDLPYHCMKRQ